MPNAVLSTMVVTVLFKPSGFERIGDRHQIFRMRNANFQRHADNHVTFLDLMKSLDLRQEL